MSGWPSSTSLTARSRCATRAVCRVLAVNGEIYNHRELRESLGSPYPFQTESDCEIILALYREHGAEFLDRLNGIFAFVLYDRERDRYLIGRDHMGIVPLYTGRDEHGNFFVASEMKALVPVCRTIEEFPPGIFWTATKEPPGSGTGEIGARSTRWKADRPGRLSCGRRWSRRSAASS
jgi:asparagine synthetase B (glutamine-hydrolysing)